MSEIVELENDKCDELEQVYNEYIEESEEVDVHLVQGNLVGSLESDDNLEKEIKGRLKETTISGHAFFVMVRCV